MQEQTYIEIMQQSLKKKIEILDKIISLDEKQKEQLEDSTSKVEDFDKTVEEKAKLIEQLNQLDSGFEKLYARVKEELAVHKKDHAASIHNMQECIRKITDKSVEIQAQEARNKELMTKKFASMRQKAKSVRTNSKIANQYYRNMMQLNYVDPQFMDTKK